VQVSSRWGFNLDPRCFGWLSSITRCLGGASRFDKTKVSLKHLFPGRQSVHIIDDGIGINTMMAIEIADQMDRQSLNLLGEPWRCYLQNHFKVVVRSSFGASRFGYEAKKLSSSRISQSELLEPLSRVRDDMSAV
jgi:predicted dinucleotide-utilizing enzyme